MKKLYITGILIVIVWAMIRFPHAMSNPGELTAGHADLNKKCVACHQYFGGIPDSKCIVCHKQSEIGKDSLKPDKILFHEGLTGQSCLSCHTDHKGADPASNISGFNHAALTAAVVNNCKSCHQQPADTLHRRLTTTCGSCHTTNSWKKGTSFDHNMIEATVRNDCASCHQSPADNYHRSITGSCDKCHTTTKWVPSSFDHSAFFRLDRGHNVTCNTCHTNNNLTAYTCYGCHEHTESRMLQKHNEEGIYNIAKCASCHKSADEHDIKGREQKENRKKDEGDDD
jgi:Class III cytochrome C family